MGVVIIEFIVHMIEVLVWILRNVVVFQLLGILEGLWDPIVKNLYEEWVHFFAQRPRFIHRSFLFYESGKLASYEGDIPLMEYDFHFSHSILEKEYDFLYLYNGWVISQWLYTVRLLLLELRVSCLSLLESFAAVASYKHCLVGRRFLACLGFLTVVKYLGTSLVQVLMVAMEVSSKYGIMEGIWTFPDRLSGERERSLELDHYLLKEKVEFFLVQRT